MESWHCGKANPSAVNSGRGVCRNNGERPGSKNEGAEQTRASAMNARPDAANSSHDRHGNSAHFRWLALPAAYPHTIILSASARSRCFMTTMVANAASAAAAITIHMRDFMCMPPWIGWAEGVNAMVQLSASFLILSCGCPWEGAIVFFLFQGAFPTPIKDQTQDHVRSSRNQVSVCARPQSDRARHAAQKTCG